MLNNGVQYLSASGETEGAISGTATVLESESTLTWGDIGTGLQVAGTAIEAYGRYKGYKQKEADLETQARLDELQADKILEFARNTINKIDTKSKKVVGRQLTTLTARGMSASGNTALALTSEALDNARQEMENVDIKAQYESYMLREKALSERNAAAAAGAAGSFAILGGVASIGATIFGGPMSGKLVSESFNQFTSGIGGE